MSDPRNPPNPLEHEAKQVRNSEMMEAIVEALKAIAEALPKTPKAELARARVEHVDELLKGALSYAAIVRALKASGDFP